MFRTPKVTIILFFRKVTTDVFFSSSSSVAHRVSEMIYTKKFSNKFLLIKLTRRKREYFIFLIRKLRGAISIQTYNVHVYIIPLYAGHENLGIHVHA